MKLVKADLFLTGFMGVGKTRIGRELALIARRKFIDLDAAITDEQGMAIPRLFIQAGEAEFRKIESRTLARICATQPPREKLVVSLGGGAILSEENRQVIRSSGKLVYLAATPESLAKRLEKSFAKRPLLADCRDPAELLTRIRELLQTREALYRQSDVTIQTDGCEARDVAELILAQIQEKN